MKFLLVLGSVALIDGGCSRANSQEPLPPSAPLTLESAAAAAGEVTIQMTSATLADECGGTGAPYAPPSAERAGRRSLGARACQQTSMQLSIVSSAASTELRVRRVELFDHKGKLLGELTARSPTVWSTKSNSYEPWDQAIAPAQHLAVSYALSAPNWGAISDRWGKTFVLKATLIVGGKERAAQRSIDVGAPARLPPGVVT